MNCVRAILIVILLGLCSAGARAQNADAAMAAEDYAAAVRLYEEAGQIHPSVANYNNMGVALDRLGQFAGAARAFASADRVAGMAMISPDDASRRRQVEHNLRRAKARFLLQQIKLPASGFVAAVIACMVMTAFFRGIASLGRGFQRWAFYRGVKLRSITPHVLTRTGQPQPGDVVYDDTISLQVRTVVSLPVSATERTIGLVLRIASGSSAPATVLRTHCVTRCCSRVSATFELATLPSLLAVGGRWNCTLVLEENGRVLGRLPLRVVTRDQLLADLRISGAQLLAVCGGQSVATTVVSPATELLVPTATIRPLTCHPSKYEGMPLGVELHCADHRRAPITAAQHPLKFQEGVADLCQLSLPLATMPLLAQKGGNWEIHLLLGRRLLARIPFAVVTRQSAVRSVSVEQIELIATDHSGRTFPAADLVGMDRVARVAPSIHLKTALPVPHERFTLVTAICINGDPIAQSETTVGFDSAAHEFLPGDILLSPLLKNRATLHLGILAILDGVLLGSRSITVRTTPSLIADVQGRLPGRANLGAIDVNEEARLILSRIQRR